MTTDGPAFFHFHNSWVFQPLAPSSAAEAEPTTLHGKILIIAPSKNPYFHRSGLPENLKTIMQTEINFGYFMISS
jgi:hypothetical protein